MLTILPKVPTLPAHRGNDLIVHKDKASRLLAIARKIASSSADFQVVLSAGKGDHATNAFMRVLRAEAERALGGDFSEKGICGSNAFKVDFYLPDEGTIVEIALGLPNPSTEFEKDILKAIMAQELGHGVRRLYFISRAGARKKCEQPGRTAIRKWAREKHGLEIEVHDLPGEARKRRRRR